MRTFLTNARIGQEDRIRREARIGPGQMGLYIILHLVNNRTLSNNRLRKVKNLRQNHQKIFSIIKFTNNDPQKNSSKDKNQKIEKLKHFLRRPYEIKKNRLRAFVSTRAKKYFQR